MRAQAVSLRQVAVLTALGLLAPAVDRFPGRLAASGGVGWLAPVLALPVLLLWLWLLGGLLREKEGLGEAATRVLGKGPGVVARLLYIMWAAVLLGARLSACGHRLGGIYERNVGAVLAVVVLALALWMALGKPGALFRAGQLFWLALAVLIVGILLLSLPKLELSRLTADAGDWGALPQSWLACLDGFAAAAFGAVALSGVSRGPGEGRQAVRWAGVLCLLCALLLAAIYGQMGASLAGRLERPFLLVVQGLSVKGAFARLEAPVAALWLLADFAALALALYAVRRLAGERAGKWAAGAVALAAVIGQEPFAVWNEVFYPGLWLGVGLPLLCRLVKMGKGRG